MRTDINWANLGFLTVVAIAVGILSVALFPTPINILFSGAVSGIIGFTMAKLGYYIFESRNH